MPRSTRRAGWRWLDGVEKDLRILGVQRYKTKAMDRNVCRGDHEDAKTHKGL
jgi:hypothetical protein